MGDHAYPKHRRSVSRQRRSGGVLSSETTKQQTLIPEQTSGCVDTPTKSTLNAENVTAEGRKVENIKDRKSLRVGMNVPTVSELAHKDHTYLNTSSQKRSVAALARSSFDGSAAYSTGPKAKRRRVKQQNTRDTDHMYNTRKTEVVEARLSRTNSTHTDHLYNLRKVDSASETKAKRPNNRDTDHLYNMQAAGTPVKEERKKTVGHSAACSDRVVEKRGEGSAVVDKMVVDKDHMYQHNSRKSRNKPDGKGRLTRSKLQSQDKPATKPTSKRKRRAPHGSQKRPAADVNAAHQDSTQKKSFLPPLGPSAGITCSDVPIQIAVTELGKDAQAETIDCDIVEEEVEASLVGEHDYTSVQNKESVVGQASSTSLTAAGRTSANGRLSPAHSDNDSDPLCEDDSRRSSGVFHTDHMYVHADYLDPEGLEGQKDTVLTGCLAGEGFKQEHSYAYSEEIRYDACMKCSGLVQQLVGTIHQQRDQIEELKKELQVAQAKNKLLSTMFGSQLQDAS